MLGITGATGQLGHLVIDHLLDRTPADRIVALSRSLDRAADLAGRGIVVRPGNYDDVNSMVEAFRDVETLLFISSPDVGTRLGQHQNVVDAAKQAGVSRIVYTSAFNIDGAIDSGGGNLVVEFIAKEHKATEGFLRESGVAWTFLRNNLYPDSYIGEIELAIDRGAYRSAMGQGGVSFISRDDIARAAAVVLLGNGHSGKVYELTGPEAVTASDFARVASEVSGKDIVCEPITFEVLEEDYRQRGMDPRGIPVAVDLERLIAADVLGAVSSGMVDLTGSPGEGFTSFVKRSLSESRRSG